MRLGKGRIPPSDGTSHWRFPVAENVTLRASGHQELLEQIFEYRLRNNIAPGDIEQEIDDWYCGQYPSFCHAEPRDTDPTAVRVSTEPMLNRVSRWVSVLVARMPRGGYRLVPPAEAESRAAICVNCPKQAGGWRGGCGGCSATTLQLLQQLKQLRKTKRDGNLSACSITGFENGSAVWLPSDVLPITEAQRAAMPAACWRKTMP